MSIRNRRLLLPLVVVAMTASACGGSSPMATVNGESIGRDEVVALRPGYADAAAAGGDEIRGDLTALIMEAAIIDAARDQFGVEITETDVTERAADPPDRHRASFEQLAADPSVGEGMVRANSIFSLVQDAVVGEVLLEGYGGATGLLGQAPQDVTRVCARHILVSTEEEALDAIDRIEDGEDFADLVTELSMDPTPEGLLAPPEGCPVHLGVLGDDFAVTAAISPIGEVVGPVSSQWGYHLLTVDDRVMPTPEQLESDAAEYIAPEVAGSIFNSWFADAVQSADVEVASMVGTWSPADVAIVPPGADLAPIDPILPPIEELEDR